MRVLLSVSGFCITTLEFAGFRCGGSCFEMVCFSLLTSSEHIALSWSYKTNQNFLLFTEIHILFASLDKLVSSFLLPRITKSRERKRKKKSSHIYNALTCGLVFLAGIPFFCFSPLMCFPLEIMENSFEHFRIWDFL